ncbi:hypothetical protein [Sphingomonas sp. LT1P40]|uniref:hypothetical protein n=1 Tax=Alteristakelama amylovorans TaxID=3096166 RepID=UPI002FC636F7
MRTLIPLSALTLLTACVDVDKGYPSLLPRPIESRDDAEPVREDPVAAPDAALDTRVATQRAAADAIAKRFQTAAIETEARVAVARGVPEGSESWLAAQTALADLDMIRSETRDILTALEETASARAQAGEPAYPALDTAISDIGATVAAQDARAKALEDALAG